MQVRIDNSRVNNFEFALYLAKEDVKDVAVLFLSCRRCNNSPDHELLRGDETEKES